MKIHLYTICWNERRLLPFFLRHYGQFCQRIVVYDNGSDDGSQAIVRAHPQCELRPLDTGGELCEQTLLYVKGETWKESRYKADWVIACDVDEMLYHPRLNDFLVDCRLAGITLPVPTGWQMVFDRFPQSDGHIYDEVQTGIQQDGYSKCIIFSPAAIREINYTPGCHSANPEGDIQQRVDPALKLLHFKFLGLEYVLSRYSELAQRLSSFNLQHGFGGQYCRSRQELEAELLALQEQAQAVPFQDSVT